MYTREMQIRRYIREDYNEVSTWYQARKLKPLSFRHVPQIGYIIPEIACGYLVQSDNGTTFLEGFITNPEADSVDRTEAIDRIAKQLLNEAKILGYKQIFALTKHNNITTACNNNEFKNIGQYNVFFREV